MATEMHQHCVGTTVTKAPVDALSRRSRQTAEVLRLLDDSFRAHRRGDSEAADRAASEACRLGVDCVSVVTGGIRIGEIPNPDRDYPAWAEYVQAAQDRARDEEERRR